LLIPFGLYGDLVDFCRKSLFLRVASLLFVALQCLRSLTGSRAGATSICGRWGREPCIWCWSE